MTMVYADDDLDNIEIFVEALADVDPSVRCYSAKDGQQVMTLMEYGHVSPDFIFLDLNMPVMDGTRCLEKLKSSFQWRDIPVFIFSTETDAKKIAHVHALGADGFIQKPGSFDQLRISLKYVLTKIRTSCNY